MQLAHNALVVVADGRKALFLRNEGDAAFPNLIVEHAENHPSPKDRDQKSDAAGGASSTQSGAGAPPVAQGGSMHAQGGGAQFAPSRGTMGEVDFHQQEEDRFAADIGAMLKTRALANEFESLIIAAPAKTLGELRKHYHVEVENRLAGEIAKDLTGHPILEIEKALSAA
ncbi:host attachment family protein [Sphingomonas sp.]|jgi:protein required for attachment to host cells|uniref:host attachment family protein n=1 Tax=Sphingomonas sp. TaxID=28214 RepID=UPI002E35BA80|nr:host attachment family protein [Sphingomonas sp.]HEX4693800.1 host attachment family protein [Sphingomonas sp.]